MYKPAYLLSCFLLSGTLLLAQNLSRPNIPGPAGLQVNSYTGNLYYQRSDLILAGKGPSLEMTFSYNSADRDVDKGYGPGWTLNLNSHYTVNKGNDSITFHNADGRQDAYKYVGGKFIAPKGIFDEVTKIAPDQFVLKAKDGTKYFYEDSVHKGLTRIEDRNANQLKLAYANKKLSEVSDASGRKLVFSWSGDHITGATATAGTETKTWKYDYSPTGFLIAATDPEQRTIRYDYGKERTLSVVKDAVGNNNTIEYNEYIAVKTLVSCQGETNIVYNGAQNKVYAIQKNNGKDIQTTYTFDEAGRLIAREGNCCGFKNAYGYDADNNIARIKDARGNNTLYSYDKKGNLLTETDPLGKTLRYTYEEVFSQIKTVTDKRGNVTQYDYDPKGNLTGVTNAKKEKQEFTYYTDGTRKTSVDAKKQITTYTYDSYGFVQTMKDRMNNITSFVYDGWGNTISVTDPNNLTTKFKYNKTDELVLETGADGKVRRTYQYYASGNREWMKDANGYSTRYFYDAESHITNVLNAYDSAAYMQYDQLGNMTSSTDVSGHTTGFGYDDQNRLIQMVNPENERTAYGYDGNGNRTTTVLPNGNTIHTAIDALNRITKIEDNLGLLSENTYDENGNKTSEKDAAGNVINYKYDELNRMSDKYDGMGNSRQYKYDLNGNLTDEIDRRGFTTKYYYDSLDRLSRIVDAQDAETIYTYDNAGNQLSVRDARKNITSYHYDSLYRKDLEKFADGSTREYYYDAEGNVSAKKDNAGKWTTYFYDKLYRLTFRKYAEKTDTFTYYPNGLMRSALSEPAKITFAYDRADRITSENLNGKTTAYQYNINKGIKTISYPSSRVIERKLDARNQLSELNEKGKPIALFQYNAAGQLTSKKLGNGTSGTSSYNGNAQIENLTYQPANFIDLAYRYNKEGTPQQIDFRHHPDESESYSTDKQNQITSFKKGTLQSSFVYDPIGNRQTASLNGVNATYVPNTMNAYSMINYKAVVNPAYDGNGNVTGDGKHSYSYDQENRIVSVDSGITANYAYDALGRRIQKKTKEGLTRYFFDGQQVIETRDEKDSVINTYVWGSWIDDIVQVMNQRAPFYYHTNHLGSVLAISDTAGKVVERYQYDVFGGLSILDNSYQSLNASSIGNTYTFTGREYEPESGLYYYRARYYDAVHGRFLQRDPLGYVDGLGLYAYANNIPSNLIDPLGTQSSPGHCDFWKELLAEFKRHWDEEVDILNGFYDFISGDLFDALIGDDANDYAATFLHLIGDDKGAQTIVPGYSFEGFLLKQALNKIPINSKLFHILGERRLDRLREISKRTGLSIDDIESFRSGKFKEIQTESPILLARYFDNMKSKEVGSYMATINDLSFNKFRDRMGFAIKNEFNNMQYVAISKIAPGTKMYVGKAAGKFPWIGGKTQYYIPKSELHNVSPILSHPIY